MGLIDWFHFYLRNRARRISENFRFLAAAHGGWVGHTSIGDACPGLRGTAVLFGTGGSESLDERLEGGIVSQRIPERAPAEITVGRQNRTFISARGPIDQFV
jgi:hypothetical protein